MTTDVNPIATFYFEIAECDYIVRQTKNLAYLMSKYLIAQVHYVKQSRVKGEGKGISENLLHDDINICVDPKTPRSLGLEKFEENFVLS